MADDKSFKELTQEVIKTNKILQQQVVVKKESDETQRAIKETNKLLQEKLKSDEKGDKLGTSIKNAAGEIINDRIIGKKARKEHDETQAAIKKSNEKSLEQDEKNQKDNTKIWKGISKTLTGTNGFMGKDNKLSLKGMGGASEERDKDEQSHTSKMFSKYLGKDSFLNKSFLKLGGYLRGFVKKTFSKGFGILKLFLLAGAYGALLKVLNSEGFKEFIKNDAPARIARFLKSIFGKGGLFANIATILSSDDSGWTKMLNVVKAIREAIFGKSEPGTYGNEGKKGGWFANLSLFNKALVLIGGTLLLKALLPKILFNSLGILLGVAAIGTAIDALNNWLFGVSQDIEGQIPSRASREDTSVQKFVPFTNVTKLVKRAVLPVKRFNPFNPRPSNNLLSRGYLGQAKKGGEFRKTMKYPKGNFFKGGQVMGYSLEASKTPATRLARIATKVPTWMKGILGWLGRRAPLLAGVMAAWDSMNIANSSAPWHARPDQDSKAKALMGIIGSLSGLTLGSIIGASGGIPGLLLGGWLGEMMGRQGGNLAYEALWLKNAGASNKDIQKHFKNKILGVNVPTSDPNKQTFTIPGSKMEKYGFSTSDQEITNQNWYDAYDPQGAGGLSDLDWMEKYTPAIKNRNSSKFDAEGNIIDNMGSGYIKKLEDKIKNINILGGTNVTNVLTGDTRIMVSNNEYANTSTV